MNNNEIIKKHKAYGKGIKELKECMDEARQDQAIVDAKDQLAIQEKLVKEAITKERARMVELLPKLLEKVSSDALDEFATKQIVSGTDGKIFYSSWEKFMNTTDSQHLYWFDMKI